MLKLLRKGAHSLRAQILSIVVVVWLVPAVALGSYIATAFFPTVRQKTENALEVGVEYSFQVTQDSIDRLVVLAKDVTYDGELTDAYNRSREGTLRYQDFYKVSRNYLERRFSRNPLISFAAFFPIDRPDQFMFMSPGYDKAMLFQSFIQKDALELGLTLDTRCQFIYRNGMLCLVRNLYNNKLERFGMLVLGIQEEKLFEAVHSNAGEWGAQVVIKMGEYEFGGEAEWEDQGMYHSADELGVSYMYKHKDYDFNLRVKQSNNTFYAEMERFVHILIAVFVLLIPVCLLAGVFVHRRVIRPITILSDASARIEAGELGIEVPMHGRDEIGRLGRGFNGMSTRLRDLVERVYKEEIALRDAKIQAMQSRINPHFLFNALETINWQARMDQNESIAQMVDALSVLLNAAMDRSDRRLVPLREELTIADAYFYFIGLRFGEQLSIDEVIDPALLEELIPPLFIQTLLENAVEHGIAPAGGGHIGMSVQALNGGMLIEVSNSGKRVSDNELERIRAMLAGSAPSTGLGLKNIQQRLRLIYLDEGGLFIDRNEAGDTVVRMFLKNPSNARDAQA